MSLYFSIRSYFEGTYTLRIVENMWELFFAIAPYLVVSIAINVLANRSFRRKPILIPTHNELLSIVSASLVGLVSPLPTYAAIPIGLSLMATGIPFSAVMAFSISSPLINPSVFFLTTTQLGMEMGLARTITAFIAGVLGGVLTMKLHSVLYITAAPLDEQIHRKPERTWFSDVWHNTVYAGKYFSIAIVLSAAVKALVDPETVSGLLGGNARVSTLVAIGFGVPLYTCGGAAIPLMKTLMALGMNKGATLAFFIAGPATKLETLYAYKRLLGVRMLVFYAVFTSLFSYACGVLYSFY